MLFRSAATRRPPPTRGARAAGRTESSVGRPSGAEAAASGSVGSGAVGSVIVAILPAILGTRPGRTGRHHDLSRLSRDQKFRHRRGGQTLIVDIEVGPCLICMRIPIDVLLIGDVLFVGKCAGHPLPRQGI
mgnify:CR=1 FL=1